MGRVILTKRGIVKERTKNKNPIMKKIKQPHSHRYLRSGLAATVLGVLVLGFGFSPVAGAVSYQAQINNLTNQNTQAQAAINGLQVQATNYQQAITAYQNQIVGIQNSIAINQAKSVADQQQIISDNAKIAQNKSYLADDLKTMYVQGQMSTIEQLATSQNLSTFVNKQEDNIKIQDQLDGLLTTIKNLQLQAQNNKNQIAVLLNVEQSQQAQVVADQNQQNQLLAMNQQQQSSYNAQLAANNSQIATLQAEQAAANAAIATSIGTPPPSSPGGTGGACSLASENYANGGYPLAWCNAPFNMNYSPNDTNGFPERQCTSYAYWYFTSVEGQTNFQVSNNAGWWWETSNYPVSTYPDVKVGAIGVEPSSATNAPVATLHTSFDGGYYGHVMIVKALPGQSYFGGTVPAGDVLVASMNEDGYGHFMYDLWPVNYLMYINPQ